MTVGDNAAKQLKSIVERVEAIEAEIKERQQDRTEIYAEARGNGFDAKAIREIVRLRKQDAEERQAHEAMVDTYQHALGMI